MSGRAQTRDVVLGVDGGNTKTVAMIVDPDGRILGAGRSGNSDIYPNGNAVCAVRVIGSAIEQALAQARLTRDALTTATYSLAGADWPEDYEEYRLELLKQGFGRDVIVVNDAIGALRAGSPDGTGVGIVAGTGVAVGARNARGAFWHSSYWQDSLGGRELGKQALRAVRHADIGMEPPTSLTAAVLDYFHVDTCADLLRLFTLRGGTPPEDGQVCRLAPLVLTEAANGDAVARRCVVQQGQRMAEYALAAAWTRGGSYTYDYKYVIDIPSAYLFYWAEDRNRPTKGAPVQFANPAQVDQEFIVLDKPDVSQSKILAFGHRAGTNEITFFSDIPRGYVRSCNDTPTFKIKYMTWKEVPFDLKARLGAAASHLRQAPPAGAGGCPSAGRGRACADFSLVASGILVGLSEPVRGRAAGVAI